MAWTSPKTYSVGDVLTASDMNTYQRDNLNATAAAVVTTAGDLVYATAANTLARLAAGNKFDTLRYDGSGAPTWSDHVGCRVTHASAQTITNNTTTNLSFDTEDYDTDTFHDTVTNNDRLTVPTGGDGRYLVGATIEFASNATGYRQLLIQHSVDGTIAASKVGAISGTTVYLNCSTIYNATAGQYFTVNVYQNSGGNLDVTTDSDSTPTFWIAKV